MTDRKIGSPKGQKAKADRLFSTQIRARGYCQACGLTQNLQCAHIISRRFANTRCNPTNALCLCAKCHHYYTDHPFEFSELVLKFLSPAEYAVLLEQAHSLVKVDWSEVVLSLQQHQATRPDAVTVGGEDS